MDFEETPARTRWGLVFAVWTIPALINAAERYAVGQPETGEPAGWSDILVVVFFWYAWALVTPIVFHLARRVPVRTPRRARALLIHLLAGSGIGVTVTASVVLLGLLLEDSGEALTAEIYFTRLGTILATGALGFLLLYAFLVGLGTALDIGHRYRSGQLRASRLEAKNAGLEKRLVEEQLQALRMQLQPHFLFNTLHAISALMEQDVASARKMIARLSDLLRVTLASEGRQEVPLEQEIEYLERYLDIERVRLGERLHLIYDVADEALDAMVPGLILQPLVENAVRYAIAPVSRPGTIRIGAQIDDTELTLTVEDDGPGLVGDSPEEGIGLANTRARLEQLHGAAGRLELRNGEGRGLTALISLPVRRAATEGDSAPG